MGNFVSLDRQSDGGFLKYCRQDTIENNTKKAVFSTTVQLCEETKETDCLVVLEKKLVLSFWQG